MSKNLEENRQKFPKETDNFIVGPKTVETSHVWEPESAYPQGGKYHKVRATTYRGGQSIEIDETEGGERIRVIHPSGSYVEMRPDGEVVYRANNNAYEVVHGEKNLRVKGAVHIQVDGDAAIKVGGSADVEVGGDVMTTVGGDYTLEVGGDITMKASQIHLNP